MALHLNRLPPGVRSAIAEGTVIPAHPLALDADRGFDPRRQRALTRYYLDSGVGGLAVGVHATQFAIREAGLYPAVLECAAQAAANWTDREVAMIAGLCGRTAQALAEARAALAFGYHAGLLSLSAMRGASEDELIGHCAAVAAEIPLVGFYLQPAAGGIRLGEAFWRRFAGIDNVLAIKVAPFDRYRTLEVAAGVAAAGAEERIALYTGNDDHILLDLLAPLTVAGDGGATCLRIRGGLLGQWSVWTSRAVETLARVREATASGAVPVELLAEAARLTDCNRAIFDAANGFAGCIPGCHEVLRRQGLLEGIWCLDPEETLSPGQADAIARVAACYPEMTDDAFVRANLERWLHE